jgi:hypothetical protein
MRFKRWLRLERFYRDLSKVPGLCVRIEKNRVQFGFSSVISLHGPRLYRNSWKGKEESESLFSCTRFEPTLLIWVVAGPQT